MNPLANTSAARAEFYVAFDRERDRIAMRWAPTIAGILARQYGRAASQFEANGDIGTTIHRLDEQLGQAISTMLKETIESIANLVFDGIMANKNGHPAEAFDLAAAEYAEGRSRDAVTLVSASTDKEIRSIIARGYAETLSNREIASLIADAAGVSGSRATTIARTETTAASNYANEVGARSTGLPLVAIWIATIDGRTRDNHLSMHNQRRANNGYFTLPSGAQMARPGDFSGPAEEVINCRCTMVWEVSA